MQNEVEAVIKLLIKEFSEKFNDFHGLYLFGIFADGNRHPDEDIEIAAMFDVENKSKREEIWPIVGKVEAEFSVYIDLHPITKEVLEKDDDYFDDVVNHGIFFPAK